MENIPRGGIAIENRSAIRENRRSRSTFTIHYTGYQKEASSRAILEEADRQKRETTARVTEPRSKSE